jgi:hypothetical protein
VTRCAKQAAHSRKSATVQHPLIPAHSRPKDGVLPHAYPEIQPNVAMVRCTLAFAGVSGKFVSAIYAASFFFAGAKRS